MSSRRLLLLLLEPVLFNRRRTVMCSCSLEFHLLRLVRLQVVRNVRLFGGLGGRRDGELLDMAFGIGGLDLRRLVALKLPKVQILDKIG
jgi:hypothetical protein